jgi:hypothetical protein
VDFEKMMREMIQQAVDERIHCAEAVEERMVRAHGEYVTVTQAAKLLNVSPSTVRRMLDDGRLVGTAQGAPLVMVRSMAEMAETGKTRREKYPDFKIVRRQA